MVRTLLVLISASWLCLAGCGSNNSGDGVAMDCEDFVTNHYCPAVHACGVYTSVSDCITAAETALDCPSLHHETGLQACEADIQDATCSELVDIYGNGAIPTSCHNVFSH